MCRWREMATTKRYFAKTYKKRRSDGEQNSYTRVDRSWEGFKELYESSEEAKERRKSAEAALADILDYDLEKVPTPSRRWPSVSSFYKTGELDKAVENGRTASARRTRNSDSRRSLTNDTHWTAFDELCSENATAKRRCEKVELENAVIGNFNSPESKFRRRRIKDEWLRIYISQSDRETVESTSADERQAIHISQSEPAEVAEAIVPQKQDGPRPRPVPVNRCEPVEPGPAKVSLPKNGLAERLSKLLRKQQSDVSIWYYRTKMGTQINKSPLEVTLKKKFYGDSACVAYECCRTSAEVNSSGSASNVLVIFQKSTVTEHSLDEGVIVKIFAPYTHLSTERFQRPVIVGPMFLQLST